MIATLAADLAVSAMLRCVVPADLEIISTESELPKLPDVFVNLYLRRPATDAVTLELARHISGALRPGVAA